MNTRIVPTLPIEPRAQHEDAVARSVHPTGIFTKFESHEVDQSIPTRFEEQVRKFPERIAVKSQSHHFTYTELNQTANRIAHAILDRRGESAEAVALLFAHDTMIVAAMLGVLKAGKFFVVLDTELPEARLDYILADAETHLILTDAQHRARATKLAAGQIGVLEVDHLYGTITAENPKLVTAPETYAYLVYTSGTSGTPKGVIENHLDVLHFVRVRTNSMHFCPQDRLSQTLPFSFSGAMTATFGSILNGATLSILDIKREGIRHLIAWLIQEQITILIVVPTTFRHMISSLQGHERFPDLRIILQGGDQTLPSDIDSFRRIFMPACLFSVGYGTSEVKIIAEYHLAHGTPTPENGVPVGYAVIDTEVLIIDEDGNEVDVGDVGEIVVRSRFISPGYWRRPEITAAKFATDPTDDGKRLYRTGDLGRKQADGTLYHLGRKDFQVKIHGQRVEVEEIESTLLKVQGVRQAAVVLRTDGVHDERLVAYVEIQKNEPSNSEIRRQLAEQLPSYMVPGHFVRLAQLPLNANGKIDRRALPMMEEIPKLVNDYIEPAAGLEATIAKIWAQFLKIERVGATDDFFELGGSSLLAAEMLLQLEKTSGRKAPVLSLLQGQTPRGMAAYILGEAKADVRPLLVAIQEKGPNLPIYLIPPTKGSALTYLNLAQALGAEQPVFAFDDAAVEGYEWTIEKLATRYLAELQQTQPHGPYVIGGMCKGATVALEMVQQLAKLGHKVALLLVLDGAAPGWEVPQDIQNQYKYYVKRLHAHMRTKTVGYMVRSQLHLRWQRWVNRFTGRKGARKYERYQPQATNARIVLYESEERYRIRHHERWQKWANGEMECQLVPGTTHQSVLKEQASILYIANDLKKRLAEVEPRV